MTAASANAHCCIVGIPGGLPISPIRLVFSTGVASVLHTIICFIIDQNFNTQCLFCDMINSCPASSSLTPTPLHLIHHRQSAGTKSTNSRYGWNSLCRGIFVVPRTSILVRCSGGATHGAYVRKGSLFISGLPIILCHSREGLLGSTSSSCAIASTTTRSFLESLHLILRASQVLLLALFHGGTIQDSWRGDVDSGFQYFGTLTAFGLTASCCAVTFNYGPVFSFGSCRKTELSQVIFLASRDYPSPDAQRRRPAMARCSFWHVLRCFLQARTTWCSATCTILL